MFIFTKKNPLIIVISLLGLLLISLLIFFLYSNKTTSEEGITRHEQIPESIANQKSYSEILVGSSLKIDTNATIIQKVSNSNYIVEVDSGEKLNLNIGDNTIIGDAWVKVDSENNIHSKSFDLASENTLRQTKVGERVWIIYVPAGTDIIPESFVVLK